MLTRSMTFSQCDLQDPVVPGHRYVFNWVTKHLPKRRVKILDIGCWTGPMEKLLEKTNCHITGIDIDDSAIQLARKNFPQFTFLKADVSNGLPFRRNTYDVVLFFMVIEHILAGTESESIININKIMKKNGKLFLSTMLSNPLSNLLDPAYFLTGHRHYSVNHLSQLLHRGGFKIIEIHKNGGWFTTFHIWMLYFFKHILHIPVIRGKFIDWLMEKDYMNNGFCEVEIVAEKMREI